MKERSGTAPISLEGASRLLNDVGACSGDKLAGEGPRGPDRPLKSHLEVKKVGFSQLSRSIFDRYCGHLAQYTGQNSLKMLNLSKIRANIARNFSKFRKSEIFEISKIFEQDDKKISVTTFDVGVRLL